MESKADLLYNQLIKDGYVNLGTPDEFKSKVKNRDKADLLFKQLTKDGYTNLGSFDEFYSKVAQTVPVKKKEETVPAGTPKDTESKSDTGFLEQPGLNPFGIGKKVRNDFETTLKAVELGVTPLELKNAKQAEIPVEKVPEMGDMERAALSTEPVRYKPKTFEEKTKEFAVDEDEYSANKESIDNIVLPPEALAYLDKNKTVVGSRGLGQSVPIKNMELEKKLKAWYALNPEGQKEYEFHKKVLNHGRDVIDKAEEIVNQKIIEATDEWRASMVQEAQYDPTGKNVYTEKPTRLLVLEAEADKIKSARKTLDAYKDAKTASTAAQIWNQIGRQIGDVATDAASFGLIPMSKDLTFFNLKKKQDEGKSLTEDEKRLLDTAAYAEYITQTYAGTATFAQDAVTAIGHSIPYMVSFASLGGLAKMATKGGTGALKASVQLAARQGLPNAMARVTGAQTSTALQVASKLSGAIGTRGAAVLTDAIDNVAKAGIQVMIDPRTYDKTIKNMTGNVGFNITDEGKVTFTGFENDLSFPQALVKAYTSQMVENLSEYSGGLLGTATRPLSRWTSKNIPALSRMVNKTKFTGTTKKFMNAAGFHGIVPEFFEEQLATIGHAIAGDGEGDWSDLTDPRQQLLTLTTVAAIGSGASMASAGIRKIGKDTAELAFNDAVNELKSQFGEDFVELGKSMTTNSVVVNEESIREILDNPGYSAKQKMAAYNYYVAGNRYYAYKENADERAMAKSEEEQLEERKNEKIIENVLTANKGIGYEQAVEIANAEIDLRSLASNDTESGNIARQNIKKFIQDAIQESKTKGGLLRYEQSEMGLPEMGERIEEQKPDEAKAKTEEVNPVIEELNKRRDEEIAALDDLGLTDTVTHELLTPEDREAVSNTLLKRSELIRQISEVHAEYGENMPDDIAEQLKQLEAQQEEVSNSFISAVKEKIATRIKEKYDAQIEKAVSTSPVATEETIPVVEAPAAPIADVAQPAAEITPPTQKEKVARRKNPATIEFDAPEVRQEVMQSLKLTLPDVDVVMDGDLEVAQQAVKANLISRGMTPEEADGAVSGMTADSGRIFNVKGKPAIIFLNPALMNDRTLGHEFWHGILAEAFGENQPMFEKFQKAIDKRLRDSGYTAISDKLTAFAEGYEAGQLDFEEYLAEFGGYLTQEGFNVGKLKGREKTLLNQIKQVINKFSKAIFGQEVFMSDATAENILEFMIAASEKMKAGEAVPIKTESVVPKENINNAKKDEENRVINTIEFESPILRNRILKSLGLTLPNVAVVVDYDFQNAYERIKKALISVGVGETQANLSALNTVLAAKNGNIGGNMTIVEGAPVVLYVNPATETEKTLGHEFWHGILRESFGRDREKFIEFREAINKKLRENGFDRIADEIHEYAEKFNDKGLSAEEYLAELGGQLTREGFDIDNLTDNEKTLLQQLKDIINRFVKIVFGQEVFMEDATAENILEFMIAASGKMKAGEAVPMRRKSDKEADATTTKSQKAQQSVSGYEMTPGYIELNKKIGDMIAQAPYYQQEAEKGSKAKKLEKHYELMLDMLNLDKAYAAMTDTQREELVINMRKELGLKVTPSPSTMIPKLLGHIENVSSITMDELELLKLKLKSEIRGVTNYKDAVAKAGVQLGKDIKELVSNNKITQKQALKILNRFRRTNLLDEISVEKFLDYIAKVFSDSNYSEFLDQMQRKREAAMSNLRDKVGNATAFIELATNMLSLKPEIIPRRALISYVKIMNVLGSNKSVLPLDAREQMMDDMHYVMKEVESAYNMALDLAIRFEEFQDKVYSEKTGDVIFGQTIKKMLAPQVDADGNVTPGVIDQGEYEIMERFRATILEEYYNSGKTSEEYQRASQEQKDIADKQRKEQEANTRKRLIYTIIKSDVDESELVNAESRRSAKELIDLIKKRAYLERMSTTDLKILSAVLSNIEDGFYPHSAQKMKERLKAIGKAIDAVDIFEKIKMGKLSGIRARVRSKFTKNESAYYHLIISNPMGIIDEALGNFKGREVYNTFIRDIASAYSVYKSEYDDIQTMLDKSLDALAKENKGKINDIVARQFLMMAYALQREYENNIGNSQVTSPFATIEETIKAAIGDVSYYGAREAKILQDILDKFGETNNVTLNADAIYSNMTPVEKDMVDNILPKINAALAPKASYTAGVLRDNAIGLLNNYIHHTVLGVGKRANQATIENQALSEVNKFMNSMNASTRSKLLTERDGKVHPIMFNIYAAASASAKSVLLDYHMTEPARVMNRTTHNVLTEMRLRENESHKRQKEGASPEAEQAVRDKIKQVREIMGAVDTAVEQTLRNTVISALGHETNLERALNEVVKQGVRSMLGSIRRSLMQELGSNMLYLATYADVSKEAMSEHMRDYVYSHTGRYVMENLSAANTQRLYPSGTISGSAIEQTQIGRYYGMKQGRTVNPIVNALMTIHNNSTKKVKNFAETTADLLISTPDKFLSRQIWFGALGIEFKRLTGEKIDMDKVAENNEEYMSLHAEHLQAAKNYADLQSIRASATDNPFLGIIKTTIEPASKNWAMTFMKTFDKFLIRFQIFEFTAARAGVVSAMGNGMLSRKAGLRLLVAVMLRSMGYTTLGILTKQMMTNLIVSMFGLKGDDEENDKNVGQALTQGFATAFTSFMFGRNLGNMWRGSVNYPIELLNQKYFSGITRGDREYDMFKDPITYSFIPAGDLRGKDAAWETAKSMTAGYSPLVKTISYSANKAIYVFSGRSKDREAYERAVKDLYIRTPLEVLGLMGYVPMYNDIRKATLDILYDDLKGRDKGPYKSDAEKAYLKSIGK